MVRRGAVPWPRPLPSSRTRIILRVRSITLPVLRCAALPASTWSLSTPSAAGCVQRAAMEPSGPPQLHAHYSAPRIHGIHESLLRSMDAYVQPQPILPPPQTLKEVLSTWMMIAEGIDLDMLRAVGTDGLELEGRAPSSPCAKLTHLQGEPLKRRRATLLKSTERQQREEQNQLRLDMGAATAATALSAAAASASAAAELSSCAAAPAPTPAPAAAATAFHSALNFATNCCRRLCISNSSRLLCPSISIFSPASSLRASLPSLPVATSVIQTPIPSNNGGRFTPDINGVVHFSVFKDPLIRSLHRFLLLLCRLRVSPLSSLSIHSNMMNVFVS